MTPIIFNTTRLVVIGKLDLSSNLDLYNDNYINRVWIHERLLVNLPDILTSGAILYRGEITHMLGFLVKSRI